MKYFDLPKISTGLALLLLASLFFTLTSRSVWLDEAMLLKNITELDTPMQLWAPLPYYDQAEPVIATLFLKLMTVIFHDDVRSLRAAVLGLSILMFLPVCFLYKHYRWGMFVLLIAVIGTSFSMGLQVTELKHYFLEVSGSFLAIWAIWKAEETNRVSLIIVAAGVISLLGFSTLIVSGGLLGYALLWLMTRKTNPPLDVKMLALFCSAALVVSSYLLMKHLTFYQISNYSQYQGGSFPDRMMSLGDVILGAFGKALLVSSVVSSIAVFFYPGRGFIYKLTVFFCAMAGVVIAGKAVGFYPVTYSRHVIWLVPFGLVISSYSILEFTSSPSVVFRRLGWVLFAALALQAAKAGYNEFRGNNYEYTNNAVFYQHLLQMPASTFLVHPNAQPAMEFYRGLDKELAKHHFIVTRDETTKSRAPEMEQADLLNGIDELFRHRPSGAFYFVASHLNLQAGETGNGEVLESEIQKFGCSYTSVFSVKDADLLLMTCRGPHEQ